jgi:cytochrome c oxidase subunit 2
MLASRVMVDPGSPFGTPFDAHSPETHAIADLFTETLIVCAVIFTVVVGLIAFCIVRFRARPGDAEPRQIEGHKKLEIVWTLVPCLIVLGLFVLTSRAMALSDAAPNHEPDLVVVGHQWWWEARYPNGAVTANEIHIPVGVDLVVRVESADVIHDFWAPALGRKVDATPGHPVFVRIQADVPGVYHGACAEYCGTQHAWMRFEVVASPRPEYGAWLAHHAASASVPEGEAPGRGAKLFAERTCVQCHVVRGAAPSGAFASRVAPDLTHFASRAWLGAGVLKNTPENLFSWLKDPQSFKPGSHMPSLRLTNDETEDLAHYLEGLR